jgi:PD-(D/E)XK endonuclease
MQPAKTNPSRTGDLAEAAFLLKASTLGFGVARPWGNAERYDFILDNGQHLPRVQVKCTTTQRARGYDVQPIYSTVRNAKSSTLPPT